GEATLAMLYVPLFFYLFDNWTERKKAKAEAKAAARAAKEGGEPPHEGGPPPTAEPTGEGGN
ncbi:MAG TPA: hypothetical protein VJ550_14475, partial [Geomonas sp.]|nr:hypothetical protein [Geomonas sp.]